MTLHPTRRTLIFFALAIALMVLTPLFAHAQSTSGSGASGVLGLLGSGVGYVVRGLISGIISVIVILVVQLGNLAIGIASSVFDWALLHTVLQFGNLYAAIKTGVETAWSAFRDIANIVIIGIFTFTAIGIILGLKEYGQKRTIAKVLVIAILINFSLLFAKIIVDASNFTALQIYNAAGMQTQSTNGTQQNIGDKFIYLMGLQSSGQVGLSVIKEGISSWTGLVTSLLYGIFTLLIYLGVAIVLLYGSFLLISRAIIIIFLLITAAIAFATYLVPALASKKIGWNTWWSSLLRSAVLAPLMMFFLWATLRVASDLMNSPLFSKTRDAAGNFTLHPTDPTSVGWLFGYLIVLGMLYATFYVSNSFSGSIANFNYAQMAGIAPLTLGGRALGWTLRKTPLPARVQQLQSSYKRRAAAALREGATTNTYSERAAGLAKRARDRGHNELAGQLDRTARSSGKLARQQFSRGVSSARTADRLGKVADSKFNLFNTTGAKKALEQIGIKGFATGASSSKAKGYASQTKDNVKKAEEIAKGAAPSHSEQAAMYEQARKETVNKRLAHRETLQVQKESADRIADAVTAKRDEDNSNFDRLIEGQKTAQETAEQNMRSNESAYNAQVVNLQSRIRGGDHTKAPAELEALTAKHASDMRREADIIDRAKGEAQRLGQEREALNDKKQTVVVDGKTYSVSYKEAADRVKDLTDEIKKYNESSDETTKAIKAAGEQAIKEAKALEQPSAIGAGREMGHFRTGLSRTQMANAVRTSLEHKTGSKKILDTLSEALKESDGGGGASTKPEDKSGGNGH